MMLHRANKPAEALAQIEQLLARDPRNPGYRNLKAVILSRVGEYERRADLRRAAEGASRRTPRYG